MAQKLWLYSESVEGAGHHLKTAQAAFCCAFAERGIDGEKFKKITAGHGAGDGVVKLWPLWRIAVRTVGFELVREVAAGEKNGATAERVHCVLHTFAEAVVVERRKARKPHAHDRATHAGLAQIVERDQHAVIQLGIALPQCAGVETFRFSAADDLFAQQCVVAGLDAHLWRAKAAHVADCAVSRCDVEIIAVEDRVR